AEDRGVGPDAERQGDDNRECQALGTQQRSQGEAKIGNESHSWSVLTTPRPGGDSPPAPDTRFIVEIAAGRSTARATKFLRLGTSRRRPFGRAPYAPGLPEMAPFVGDDHVKTGRQAEPYARDERIRKADAREIDAGIAPEKPAHLLLPIQK